MSEIDNIDEELEIMQEQMEAEHSISNGINIEDPIKTLNLSELVHINQNASLKETIDLLNGENIGCLLITDDSENPVGIFTERDILKRVCSKGGIELHKEKVKDFMTPNPEMLSEDDPIAFALNRMSDGSYRHIPVMHGEKVKWMLSVKDIVDQISFTYRKNVLNLPPNLRQTVSEYGG